MRLSGAGGRRNAPDDEGDRGAEREVRIKERTGRRSEAIRGQVNRSLELVLLETYPSGDEYELVYSATGRLIPPAAFR